MIFSKDFHLGLLRDKQFFEGGSMSTPPKRRQEGSGTTIARLAIEKIASVKVELR